MVLILKRLTTVGAHSCMGMVQAVYIAADEISKPMLKLFAGQLTSVIGHARSCCEESRKIGLLLYYTLLSRSEKTRFLLPRDEFGDLGGWPFGFRARMGKAPCGWVTTVGSA